MERLIALAATLAALGLGACGSDDEPTTPVDNQGEATATTAVPPPTTTTQTEAPTAPASAEDPSSGAPDAGITEKPGGSESSGGGY